MNCYYCGKVIYDEIGVKPVVKATRDHIIAKSKGGSGPKNIVLACSPCNKFKGDLTLEEFIIKVLSAKKYSTMKKSLIVSNVKKLIEFRDLELNSQSHTIS